MSNLDTEFEQAARDVQNLKSRPSNDALLELYAWFKQASSGDVSGSRPGMLDIKGRAKFDAWTKKKGIQKEVAQKGYIDLVKKLLAS